MLSVLAAAHPSRIDEVDLARLSGLAPTSRRLKPCLERLSRKGLIVRTRDGVRAIEAYVELHHAMTAGRVKSAA